MPRPERVKLFKRACVFCLRPAKMTSEHVWGDWLKSYIPRIANKHTLHRQLIGRLGTRAASTLDIRAGSSPIHSSVRVVCEQCNTDWLSKIQQEAKPHLLPLVQGQTNHLIGVEAQTAIAKWATMATMTAEFIHGRFASIAISQEARTTFKERRQPFANWRIWIGHYHRRRWDACYVHACQPIYLPDQMVIVAS